MRYRDPISAQACVRLNHGRFFGGRQVIAYIDDGQEKLQQARSAAETEQEQSKRLEKYAQWLEQGGQGPAPGDSSSEEEDDDDDVEQEGHGSEDDDDADSELMPKRKKARAT